MRVLIVPDSFKGSASSVQVADAMEREVKAAFPDCITDKIPIADGGEGSLDTLLSVLGGQRITESVLSPDDRRIEASYGITQDGTAILEMAESSGITKQIGLHPMTSSTYGFGELIRSALRRKARSFILCIGGSATTDGGCGMAAALGARFVRPSGEAFVPCGGTLGEIGEIDLSRMEPSIPKSRFVVMCDVENPLWGPHGAAHIYGKQKGASPQQIEALDAGLRHLGEQLVALTGIDYAQVPGAGAAGGLGAGCLAFLGARLESGSTAILDLFQFDQRAAEADLILTGEGRLDEQSFSGKVLSGVLRAARGVPVISICGTNACDEALLRRLNVKAFESGRGVPLEHSMAFALDGIRRATREAMQWVLRERKQGLWNTINQ